MRKRKWVSIIIVVIVILLFSFAHDGGHYFPRDRHQTAVEPDAFAVEPVAFAVEPVAFAVELAPAVDEVDQYVLARCFQPRAYFHHLHLDLQEVEKEDDDDEVQKWDSDFSKVTQHPPPFSVSSRPPWQPP